MKKLSSIFIFTFLAVIFLAFNPIYNAFNNDVDSPSYEIAKHKFFEAYQEYKNNLNKGIKTTPPVDPSGNFKIDENGNFNMINVENNQTRAFDPKLSPDVVATYLFTQSTNTYTAINGTGTLVAGSQGCDDIAFGPFPIGFTFTYNGVAYTDRKSVV